MDVSTLYLIIAHLLLIITVRVAETPGQERAGIIATLAAFLLAGITLNQ